MTRECAVGIDLHGTLLDETWQIPDRLADELDTALRSVQPLCELFLCTGNDLTFVQDRIGHELASLFDGFVLETGCVVSHGSDEEVLVPPGPLSSMKALELRLREDPLPGIEYFGRRLATISLFTKTERGGADPTHLFPLVTITVEELGFRETVLVTHSDVAVDIIPAGFNKFTGLRRATKAPFLIGIADSLNDLHLIANANWALLPANASPSLLAELGSMGRRVEPLSAFQPGSEGTIGMSESRHTEAVIEILSFLCQHLH